MRETLKIRDEMEQIGAQEIQVPMIVPGEIWQQSGRWDVYGPELLRLKDRHGRDFVVGPTHEETFVDLVMNELRSYKQLPVTLYQIQDKFRAEIRPRFGLMRGREFIMKDAAGSAGIPPDCDQAILLLLSWLLPFFTELRAAV